ncbi:DUF3006 domain-containing protein [Clostridium sp. MB40-C1]|uniref:DUF3006 domain-containing protein n=1 Tax=Clostridium sp. MB40-C1 TaxID=3070996 RepID=UPI0027DF2636|nr:DUF3006 domain-containing protein [Clostridium sp. MB40-C1]WMJ80108.1 DUF3006 domain-containing protein [Clostridium sp. MB40-C1]
MFGVIDRFEGDFAVIELDDGKMINVKRNILPKEMKEGYVLNMDEQITFDYEETQRRKAEIEKMMEDLFES